MLYFHFFIVIFIRGGRAKTPGIIITKVHVSLSTGVGGRRVRREHTGDRQSTEGMDARVVCGHEEKKREGEEQLR
jgi:hypothetical protein